MTDLMAKPVSSHSRLAGHEGDRDGLHEQIVLLNRISEELEIYFTL